MTIRCPNGHIVRKSYTRKTKSGKTVRVPATCVKDKGRKGKTPKSQRVLPKLKKGGLGKYGYSNVKNLAAGVRRKALEKGIKKEGYAPIVRRLNVIRTYNKNNLQLFKIFDSDMKWIQRHMKPLYAKSK